MFSLFEFSGTGALLPDGPALRAKRQTRSVPRLPAVLGMFAIFAASNFTLHAGDILRGGAPSGSRPPTAAQSAGAAEAARARANAKDALARTSQALKSVQQMQINARKLAEGRSNLGADPNHPGQQLPNVPNGLAVGGLEVAPGVALNSPLWRGATLPRQNQVGGQTEITIQQTAPQAVLNWKTFNVGSKTTVAFDQSNGGSQKGQWIAFNKVQDPSGVPSQILGQIKAPGQVYVINPNGIIFGGGSQVNVRSLVASSLPINDNLVQQGLLNNRDAQFLFSSLSVPGGSDGTPTFNPITPPTPTGRPGDVVVQAGAQLNSEAGGDGNGGRVMLVGPNVRNEGTISTPAGQTILAAGLQVGITAHADSDPSLRGLDVWIGDVGDYAGTSTNSGLIQATTGSAWMAGRYVNQLGVIDSTTSVNLNGRIDLKASYGAVANPNYDNPGAVGAGGPAFLYQSTGVVTLGEGSATQILPDYASKKAVPGTTLPQKSQINIEGQAVHFRNRSMLLAPNADVTIRAGVWPYRDADGNRTISGTNGQPEPGIDNFFTGLNQKFFFSGGQIYLEPSSFINVAGSTDVFVPLAHSILNVELRGSEFADSPVQRNGVLRGSPLTVDIRRTGVSNGRYWMGTPLGDVTGLAGLIERNAAQLTATGGSVTMQAGGSIVVQGGATIDVSGGFFQHAGGLVKTTRLLQYGRLVDIHNAQPGQVYDGVYTGTYTRTHARWGVSETFTVPWMTGERYEQGYLQGANGGTLKMTAASMALDGQLLGITIDPPRGRASSPEHSRLTINFGAEKTFGDVTSLSFLPISPTPPAITFGRPNPAPAPPFKLVGDVPVALPAGRTGELVLSPDLLGKNGFGHLSVENTDGNIVVPEDVTLAAPALGSIALAGANVEVRGKVAAPSGKLSFTAYTISPAVTAEFPLANPAGTVAPPPNSTRGQFTLTSGAGLNAAGLIVDDRLGSPTALSQPLAIAGGSVSILAYGADLAAGSTIDVSGGVAVSGRGAITYGDGGSISIRTGKDPGFARVTGGRLALQSTLSGYSGKTGGSLTIQANTIQIGGSSALPGTLLLQPDFFRTGGFTSYNLEGIGAASGLTAALGELQTYTPAILIAPGTTLAPVAENWLAIPNRAGSRTASLTPMLKEASLRTPVSLSFTALGADDNATTNILEARGDFVMGQGAKIVTDPGAKVTMKGQTVTVLGSVEAPGGTITLEGLASFPVSPDETASVTAARSTVYLGPTAKLSAAGTTLFVPDAFGRRLGTVFSGGAISVSGNIVAEQGAGLDVSGTSAKMDVHPTALGNVLERAVPANSGLNSSLWKLRTVPTRIDSNGGTITLAGSEMLFSDATLLGRAGGPTAIGGSLTISSGRFYASGSAQFGSDINLVVTQSGQTIATTNRQNGIGRSVRDAAGAVLPGMGYFAVDRFTAGGFDALDLGYTTSGSGVSVGANIEFRGPVSIKARSSLKIAGGGVILADSPVSLTAPYVAIGQAFPEPLNPLDAYTPFRKSDPGSPGNQHFFPPTFGPGSLTVTAQLIDIGNLVLRNVGQASFIADNGDIRGNGTLNIAGDLTLRAAQVYPTTLATFNIFAYDHAGLPGSVTITGSGSRSAPLSVGGNLNIFASRIQQSGVLRAPLGTITLGWDGSDFDLSDADLDTPPNPLTGTTLATPVAQQVTLKSGSVTSVAAWSGTTGSELLLPFGLSPDGSSWIDPRGVNVTISGLPEKRVSIAGNSVTTERGSLIDLRGGGDLYGYRWTPGTGGSADLLGSAGAAWVTGTEYQPGDLVTSGGKTWSARVRHSSQKPSASLYWTEVPESYAVIPDFRSEFAPYAPFNIGSNAGSLGGDPGYVSSTLKIGDRIYLEGIAGLKAGAYTLLPRRYALLPGAFLVTPTSGATYGSYTVPEGATFVAGYRLNEFTKPGTHSTLRTNFEVAPFDVIRGRAAYDDYLGNAFFPEAAQRFDIARTQPLPRDAGYLGFSGNAALQLNGRVLSNRPAEGRGAMIDISSLADMYVTGGTGTAPVGATVVIDSTTLNSWGADSLLIGGSRRRTTDGTVVTVRTNQVTVNNPGEVLAAPEVVLASKSGLTIAPGSTILSRGELLEDAEDLRISGDGALVRVSSNVNGDITRTNTTASTTPLLTVGAGARLAGRGVTLDSTYGTNLSPVADIEAYALNLGSGQISIDFRPGGGALTGAVVPQHLVLADQLLSDAQNVQALTLRSYRTIDVYGAGIFGSPSLGSLSFLGGGLRGYGQGAGTARFQVGEVVFGNPSNIAALPAPAATTGTLQVDARIIRFGTNTFATSGYQNVALNATAGVLGEGTGGFTTTNDLTIATPVITGARGSNHTITAGGALALLPTGGTAGVVGGLGATFNFTGTSIVANTDILLPSGLLTLRSTGVGQNVSVGGRLNVAGVAQKFYDLTRYSDGGSISLTSDRGSVELLAGSVISVAAPVGGGNAGTVAVEATQGAFNITGATLLGSASAGNTSGSFLLDAGSLPSFDNLTIALNTGGFFEQRNLRVRTGNVTITNPGGQANVARNFVVSTDTGNIVVNGTIDGSGTTGGKIALVAGGNLTVSAGAILTVHATNFSSAGKGGEIRLEAGATFNGVANTSALLDLTANSTIDLGVDELVAGDFTTPGSSAFYGQFTGTLHLRAPRTAGNNDLRISAINSTISGASSITAEGFQVVNLTASGGLITGWRTTFNVLPTAGTVQRNVYDSANSFLSVANHNAMRTRLLGADAQGLAGVLVLAPGVEIINTTGNLTLGLTNATSTGSAALNSADWNLSDFRFGPKQAPGILTLRAAGDVVFNNALSDGFTPVTPSSANGNSALWLALLKNVDTLLPTNTQSWSYRITAGADFGAADFTQVRDPALLGASGSIIVGQFYNAVPNSNTAGASPAVGSDGLTANSIRISTTGTDTGTRFEVVRTGTGSITLNAGRDVQLRNQFATIYTAGARIPNPQNLFETNDFRPPTTFFSGATHPSQGQLGVPQQYYGVLYVDENGNNRRIPQWAISGGEVSIQAARNIGRYYTLDGSGNPVADSSRQLPNNWLNRSGYVDPNTGLFGAITESGLVNPSVATSWWIDYSNFFEGVGALGGGNVSVVAGGDIANLDAVIPTTARMSGRDPLTGLNIAPDASKLVELGGGDLLVKAGRNVDAGVYYVERGNGVLSAGNQIVTNSTRSPSFGILNSGSPEIFDSRTWLPTTLFLGKGGFDVSARGDILLGPVVNTFLLPAGLNNKAWYRTHFNTYAEDSSVDVSSYGGSVTHRLAITLPGRNLTQPILQAWLETQNVFNTSSATSRASYYQPWIRLAETDVQRFATVSTVLPPILRSTAFGGDINVVGSMNLFPSSVGTLELAAAGGVIGLQPTGIGRTSAGVTAVAWTSAKVNLSDADPTSINGITTPSGVLPSGVDYLGLTFSETGSFTGNNAAAAVKRALHASTLLHAADTKPLRLYAGAGDITGVTLFSPKPAQVLADGDITDVAFYVQNTASNSISIVAAGRDLVLFNENSPIRSIASSLPNGNYIAEAPRTTVLSQGGTAVTTLALAGDIQISGPGVLEVLAGRNIDLGTGANLTDGTGVGITSIGNSRNPALAFEGADIIALAGVSGAEGGAALGLSGSTLDFTALTKSTTGLSQFDSEYLKRLGSSQEFEDLTEEQQAIVGLELFFDELRNAGRSFATTGSYAGGFAAVSSVFGSTVEGGEIFTRARDIRTSATGAISIGASGGGVTMASDIFGNPLTPPGIVTEYGGSISIFTDGSVDIGQARIFTLRGGDITIWSTGGDIAAGTSPKTVVTAPPTRVIIDTTSADVKTDLGGLATGGGIGVLASVAGVQAGDVDLIAPSGVVDAGDAGIRSTGNLNIAANAVLNASNIQVAGSSSGVPSAPTVAAPNLGALGAANAAQGAQASTASETAQQQRQQQAQEEPPSIITVEVLGYGGTEEQ